MKNAIRLTSLVLAAGFCASAFAGSDQPQANQSQTYQRQTRQAQVQVARPKKRIICFVMTTASGIPVPCDRIKGIATTASPMDVIGNKSPN
jgi:hypothetical protein